MSNIDFSDNGVPYSNKTKELRNTLGQISIKNLQAIKLMNNNFRLIDQFGRKPKNRTQSGDAAVGGMYQLGSSRAVKTPRRI